MSEGSVAAIYARISHIKDDDQTKVERQVEICRAEAARLGLRVPDELVFSDSNRSAWQRNRKRKGWDKLLEAARAGTVAHIITYHPDRLMRQPHDLEELLAIADDRQIVLHGRANQRDLSSSDDRFMLRIEVAHACKSSDDTARRVRDKKEHAARHGVPHTSGIRRYGYSPKADRLIPDEAEIVREIYRRFVKGGRDGSFAVMVREFNKRQIPTADGRPWTVSKLRTIVDAPHYAGLASYHGTLIRDADGQVLRGNWDAIVDAGLWAEAHRMRAGRNERVGKSSQWREYVLRGLVICERCGALMEGTNSGKKTGKSEDGEGDPRIVYRCRNKARDHHKRIASCTRSVEAEALERFVEKAAVDILVNLDLSTLPAEPEEIPTSVQTSLNADATQLEELDAMWTAREIDTTRYREMRTVILKRMDASRKAVIRRPAATVLTGLTGPGAPKAWAALRASGDTARANTVLRFLIDAVRIKAAHRGGPGFFDVTRIDIEPRDL